jgi:hypothetical protein
MRSAVGSLVHNGVVVVLSIPLLVVAGCTGSDSISLGKLVPVKGKVTCNGQPAPAGCVITFQHTERNFPASAETAADGSYTLLFNGKPEVPLGTYKVSIRPPAGEAEFANPSDPEAYKKMMEKAPMARGNAPAKTATIPKKYASPETSGVTFTVVENQTEYDVAMKQ